MSWGGGGGDQRFRVGGGSIPGLPPSCMKHCNLSAPAGDSINDYIEPLDFSLQYSTIDDAIAICHRLGRGALIRWT